jgi:hypothetical protein
MGAITSVELNFLVFCYLQELGSRLHPSLHATLQFDLLIRSRVRMHLGFRVLPSCCICLDSVGRENRDLVMEKYLGIWCVQPPPPSPASALLLRARSPPPTPHPSRHHLGGSHFPAPCALPSRRLPLPYTVSFASTLPIPTPRPPSFWRFPLCPFPVTGSHLVLSPL